MKNQYLQYSNTHHQTFINLVLNIKIDKIFYVNYQSQHLIFLIIQEQIDQLNREWKNIADTSRIVMGHECIVITSIMFCRIVPFKNNYYSNDYISFIIKLG